MKVGGRFILFFLICGLGGCASWIDQFAATFGQMVTIPQTDPTPPRVTLVYPDPVTGKNVVVGPSDSPRTVQLDKGTSFFAVAIAEDSGGVKSVGFVGGTLAICQNGQDSESLVGDIPGVFYSQAGQPGGKALTRLWFPTLVDDSFVSCGSSMTRTYGSISLTAKGSNFSNITSSSAAVTFVFKP
ncbi:hypothetical protein PO002_42160 [Cupriavidus necator]